MNKTTITYDELLNRLGQVYRFNKAPDIDEDFYYDGLENGYKDTCNEHDSEGCEDCANNPDAEYTEKDIFQWYLIDDFSHDYLIKYTDELVFYSKVLGEYVWAVTHYGTPWRSVYLDLKEQDGNTSKITI